MPVITSPENPRFRELLKLRDSSRARRQSGQTLLDGIHLVAAHVDRVGAPRQIVVSRAGLTNPEIRDLLERAAGSPLLKLGDALFRRLSPVETPTGILALIDIPPPRAVPEAPGPCVVLEAVQDPGNLGSILRSAAAAGIGEIYLSSGCADAWSPRVLRAGMGAHFGLELYEACDLDALLRRYPGRVVATDGRAALSVFDAELTGRVALVLGNEGAGVSPGVLETAADRIAIPMPGGVESLNVAAAAAIVLFERVRQLGKGRQRPAIL